MEEAYELESSSCKHKGEVPEEHIYSSLLEKFEAKENKCRCSKMCAQIVFIVIIFTSLALVISVGLIFHVRDSERMDRIEADIAEVHVIENSSNLIQNKLKEYASKVNEQFSFLLQKELKEYASKVNEQFSFLLQKELKEYASKVNEQFSFLLQKVRKNWLCNDTSCYYFSIEKLNWSTAQESCRQLGATLIEIDSTTENEFVTSNRHNYDLWIGATYMKKEGTWKWAESNRLLSMSSFTNWAVGEPNNKSKTCSVGEDCAMIYTGAFSNGKWNDVCCSYDKKFICEEKNIPYLDRK